MSEKTCTPQNYVFMQGKYVPYQDAKISVRNHTFLYGTSLFEGIRAYWNQEDEQLYVFRAKEHFERMHRNSRIMHMNPLYSVEKMCEITKELLLKNAPKTDTYIRPTLYKTAEKVGPGLLDNPDDFLIFTTPLGDYVDTSKGLKVCVSNWRRNDDNAIPPRAKISGCYANTALIVTDAKLAGFDDAIVLSENGHVTEGSAMNLYLVENGKLITTNVTDNILIGITRNTIKELAQNELGIEVIEREIDRTELYIGDEAFYCGTGAQVSPITSIDNRAVGDGKVGEITKKLQSLYFDTVKGKIDKYKHWCMPVYDN
ncbi:MAG: branched-chain amino acid transaminase [Candidatus Gastranaerophilales bacterium]|nr:branched-chain amino acid transaminase [Candidatus Gastranaerophilales bacterium]